MNDRINKDTHPALESLLSGLNRDQLQSLLLKLSEQEPSLTAAIERQVALLPTSSSQQALPAPQAPPKPRIAVDPKAARRQVRSTIHSLDRMRSSEADWRCGPVANEIGQLCAHAGASTPAHHSRQPLTLLTAMPEHT